MLIYFARGSLPWQGLKAETEAELKEKIRQKKASMSGKELCRDLPDEFANYIDYIRSLPYGRKPDYVHLRAKFRQLFSKKGVKYDKVFDWTERLFNEFQNRHPARHRHNKLMINWIVIVDCHGFGSTFLLVWLDFRVIQCFLLTNGPIPSMAPS
jgi:hypothetical protein